MCPLLHNRFENVELARLLDQIHKLLKEEFRNVVHQPNPL